MKIPNLTPCPCTAYALLATVSLATCLGLDKTLYALVSTGLYVALARAAH